MSFRQNARVLSSPSRRKIIGRPRHATILVVLVGLIAASCGSDGSSDSDDGASEEATTASGETASGESVDELTIATPSLPLSFAADAGGGGGLEYQEFLKLNNATLLRNPYVRNEDGNLQQDIYNYEGYLAERYETSADGMTITFYLRQGVKSPAGNEFTADDVIWSFERKYNTPTATAKSTNFPYITDVSQWKKIDTYTLSFSLNRASDAFTFLSLISNIVNYIYDSTLLKSHATPDDPYAAQWSKTNANFSYGPYILESLTPDQGMVLRSNPDHPLGEPSIKKLTFKVVTDPGSRANALRSGDVDIASALLPADQVELAESPKFKIYDFDTNSYLFFTFVTNHPPFDDKRVRQALAYATPYQQIIDGVYASSRAKTSIGMLQTDAPNYDGSGLPEYTYDPEKAKALLAEAGYEDGVKFTITVSNAVPDVQAAAVLLQSFAKAAGFEIAIDQLPVAAFNAGRNTHEWDSFMWRDYAITLSPFYQLWLFFKEPPAPNATAWAPKAYHEILARGIEAGDPLGPEAGKVWNEAQRYYLDEMPMLFMVKLQPLNAFRAGIENFAWRSDNLIDYFPLEATKAA